MLPLMDGLKAMLFSDVGASVDSIALGRSTMLR